MMPAKTASTLPTRSSDKPASSGSWGITALVAGAVATLLLLWTTSVPLGVPGEWEWSRIEAANSAEWLFGMVQAAFGVGLYLIVCRLCGRGIEAASRLSVAVRLIGLFTAACTMQWMVQESPPGVHRLQKSPLVLYAPSTSGYFFHQRFHVNSLSEFLRGYEAWVRKGDVLHFGTHPPGLFVLHRGISALCEWSPKLTAALQTTEPDSVRETFEVLREFPMGAPASLTATDRASLWLASLISLAMGIGTLFPLFGLVRQRASRRTAWFAAVLWPLVPASVVFQPKSDVLYPFVGMLFLWCWTAAFQHGRFWKALIAGSILFAGLFTSLAILPVAVLGAILFLTDRLFAWKSAATGSRVVIGSSINCLPGLLLGFWIPVVLLWMTFQLNLPAVWWQNLVNHGSFYEKFPRTLWKWWLVNPLELTIAAGWPVAFLAGRSIFQAARGQFSLEQRRQVVFCLFTVILLLWLSGKNSSEAARLWIFLMPWLIWAGAMSWEEQHQAVGRIRRETVVLLCQSAVLIGTVLRVTGFSFPGG